MCAPETEERGREVMYDLMHGRVLVIADPIKHLEARSRKINARDHDKYVIYPTGEALGGRHTAPISDGRHSPLLIVISRRWRLTGGSTEMCVRRCTEM